MQRTIFELQLVFESYINSDNKDKFIEIYNKKSNFESVIKWDKLIKASFDKESNIFSEEDQKIVTEMKNTIKKALKDSTNERQTKIWYELAFNKKNLGIVVLGIFLIEIAQYVFYLGIFDVGDIIANTAGFIVGTIVKEYLFNKISFKMVSFNFNRKNTRS